MAGVDLICPDHVDLAGMADSGLLGQEQGRAVRQRNSDGGGKAFACASGGWILLEG